MYGKTLLSIFNNTQEQLDKKFDNMTEDNMTLKFETNEQRQVKWLVLVQRCIHH